MGRGGIVARDPDSDLDLPAPPPDRRGARAELIGAPLVICFNQRQGNMKMFCCVCQLIGQIRGASLWAVPAVRQRGSTGIPVLPDDKR